jgi:DNA mismatch endonuclease (patch repair protein)
MADHVNPGRRSEIMSSIGSRHTGPEMLVRSLIHRMGFRFRLHIKELPGTPDIVLPRLRKIVLVNGCLWHGHAGCSRSGLPKSNSDFWETKVAFNRLRDSRNLAELRRLGWDVLQVWQCQMRSRKGIELTAGRLSRFLDSQTASEMLPKVQYRLRL